LSADWELASSLIWSAGGTPFTQVDGKWLRVTPAGRVDTGRGELLDPAAWTASSVADAVAHVTLRPVRYADVSKVAVLTPPQLGRLVLRKSLARGLNVTLTPVRRSPLSGTSNSSGGVLLRLSGETVIPRSLVSSLSDLPYTTVADASAPNNPRLLVDVRFRTLVNPDWLTESIGDKELWMIGPPDVGRWRVEATGRETDGGALLDLQDAPLIEVPPAPEAALPTRLPVMLADTPASGPVDAVLLDDRQLAWAAKFFLARPNEGNTFIIPGMDVHLLIGSGSSAAPFGTPLTRIGPQGLYLEQGKTFYPAMPNGARLKHFPAADNRVVAVTSIGAFSFPLDRLLPVWSLWTGDAMPVQEGLSRAGQAIVTRIAEEVRKAERIIWERQQKESKPAGEQRSRPEDEPRLVEEATKEEARGNLVHAAELMERAGRHADAGRLFERAAYKLR
jgi:hypothetical protein